MVLQNRILMYNLEIHLHFQRQGGSSSVISGGNNWTMDTLTANVLRMTSHFGLLGTSNKITELFASLPQSLKQYNSRQIRYIQRVVLSASE